MSLPVRMILLALLIAALVGLGLFIGDPEKQAKDNTPPPGQLRFHSSTQCAACHREVFDEWHGSHHQISYLNPEVQALSDDFRNKECQACHLPRPVAVTGYAKRTLHRSTLPNEGVSCLSCHLAADGTILGRNGAPDAPCQPRANAAFASVSMCESCHNQHWTTDQWRKTPFAQQGRECNACHMPEVLRRNGKKGRGHSFRASHDVSSLRRAIAFRARVEAGEVIVEIENIGAGHNFPTEERSRAADVVARFDEAKDWRQLHRFRLPYRSEPLPDTTLPHGEKKVLRIAIPAEAQTATVRLWYRLTPFVGDADARSALLFEQELDLSGATAKAVPLRMPELPAKTVFRPRKELAEFAVAAPTAIAENPPTSPSALPPLVLTAKLAHFQELAAQAPKPPVEKKARELREMIETAFVPGAATTRTATLVRRGLLEDEFAWSALEAALAHEKPAVRTHAAFELGRLGRPSSVLPLLLRLKYEPLDGDPTVVAWVADALARLGNFAGLPFLIVQMGQRETAEVAGLRAIEICRNSEVTIPTQPTWDDLGKALGGLHETWRSEQEEAAPDAATAARIAKHLTDLEQFQLRGVDEARFVLTRMGTAAMPLLREALRAREPYLRTHALEIVRQRGVAARSAASELIPLLGDELTQADAARALGRIDAADAVPHLRAMLATPRVEVRAAVARALGELGAKEAATELQTMLEDATQPIDVRVQAAFSLGLLNPESPGRAFLKGLRDDGGYHRPTLVELLEHLDAKAPR